MIIQTVPVQPTFGTPAKAGAEPEVFKIEVQGPLDSNAPAIQRARKLLQAKGSADMLESFDWAVQNDVLFRTE